MRILHFADVHLDRPLVGLPPDVGRRRRHELRAAFRRCLVAAREHNADLVTIGGDLWEDEHVTSDTRRFVASELKDLDLPVLMICGNHDPYLAGGNYARFAWPENVQVCRHDVVTEFRFDSVSVWAISWLGGRLEMSFLDTFAAPKDSRTHLLLAHGTAVRPGDPYSDSAAAPFAPERVADSGFVLCLAGHVHAGGQIGQLVYPGSPEPLGWGEMGRHTVSLVDVGDRTARVTFLDVNMRRYVAREIDCEDAASSAAIEQRVREALTDPDPGSVYLRLDLKGLVASDCDVDTQALEEMCRGNYAALQIRDHTFPEYDLRALERQNTATGHFVRSLQARINETIEPADRSALELAVRLGLHALHGRKELIHVG